MQNRVHKKIWRFISKMQFLLLFICLFFTKVTFAFDHRLFLWGLAGSEELARLDFLIPLYVNDLTLLYTDIQGEVDTQSSWFTGLGLGLRELRGNRIYGFYGFLDRDFSTNHHFYYIVNAGFETLGETWDFRTNGYYPASQKRFSKFDTPSFHDTCGENVNCHDAVFSGHQEFLPVFRRTEEVGPGIDAEIGAHFGANRNFSIYGGGYYYRFKDEDNMVGVEARIVLPISTRVALTIEASVDNIQNGAVVGGIRIQGGHLPHAPMRIEDHFYDPITRNLGTVKSGSSVPIVEKRQFDHLALIRDNIFFFSSTGGGAFNGVNSGTFENPLDANQFNQGVVDSIAGIAPAANLFFNTGTFVINPISSAAPNASIALPRGQSIFGRTSDFYCSAVDTQRPLFLGEIELLEGNNRLDSIRLTNSLTLATAPAGTTEVIALNIQNANDVFICNSMITANLNILGDSLGDTSAIAIAVNNSTVIIDPTAIIATSNINGDATGEGNSAIGIGNHNTITENNQITLIGTELFASATVSGSATYNSAVGIGNVATSTGILANFNNNTFAISHSQIAAESFVSGGTGSSFSVDIGTSTSDNTLLTPETADFLNNTFSMSDCEMSSRVVVSSVIAASGAATGIGGIAGDFTSARFTNNRFTLNRIQINSMVTNSQNPSDMSITFSSGIGGNFLGDVSFLNNVFSLIDSQINSTVNNLAMNTPNVSSLATGIGSNVFGLEGLGRVDGSQFTLQNTGINVSATSNAALANNFVTAIGSNAVLAAIADFGTLSSNNFTIINSVLNSFAIKARDNGDGMETFNFATGIGGNADGFSFALLTHTLMEITNSNLTVRATVERNNIASGVNFALGIKADDGSAIDFTTSVGQVEAIVAGMDAGINNATAFVNSGGAVSGGENITAVTIN